MDHPGVIDPPHVELTFPKPAHVPSLDVELRKLLGGKLLGVSCHSEGCTVHLIAGAGEDDKALVARMVLNHDPTPPPAPPTLEQQLADALERIKALEQKAK